MAMNVESIEHSTIGLRVEGDLGDLQIIEESSEDEEDSSDVERRLPNNISSLANIPNSLVKASTTPVIGAVQVTNSDNVQFGNNTYFNGPVTIKQVIQTGTGVDNVVYEKTEDEIISTRKYHNSDNESSTLKKFQVRTWHKLLLSTVGVIIVGSICAIILGMQKSDQEEADNLSEVEGLLISPEHLRIVDRTDWLAQPVEEKIDRIRQPVPWVIITHTATESCFSQSECVLRVRLMQTFHIESRGWSDIGYNFLVGGDGSAYYGRGWDQIGAHTKGYNKYSIGIAFIGTFNSESPTKHQVDACKKLLRLGVAKGKLVKDYKLLVHRQLLSTLSPGDKVLEIIKTWPHFFNESDIASIIPNY